MKKVLFILLISLMVIGMATGCSNGEANVTDTGADQTNVPDATFSIAIGDKTFTNEEAKDVEFVTVDVKKADKEGNLKDAKWEGYRLKDVLNAVGITEYTTVTVASEDGFGTDLTAETVNIKTTILGFVKDGETLDSSEMPRLVVDGEGSKVWIKGVASITIQ